VITVRLLATLLLTALLAPTGKIRWEAEQRLTDDPAPSLLTYNFARSLAVDATGRLHAVWYDSRGGQPHVFYRRSTNGGRNWEAEVRLSEGIDGQHPSVAAAGSSVFVVWYAFSGAGLNIFLRRSADGGTSWDAPVALTTSNTAAHASIAASRGLVYVVWGERRDGTAEIYGRRSTDGGTNWEAEHRFSDLPFESWVPTVAVSGDRVWVAWVDLRDGNEEEYVQASSDGGATWSDAARLTSNSADSWAPSVVIASGVAHVTWFDRRDAGSTHADVEAQLDAILTLMGLPVGPAPPFDPHVYYLPPFMARVDEKRQRIQDGAPAWVASGGDPARLERELREFERRMRDWASGWEIYYKRSADGGASWTEDTRLTVASGVSARPSIAADGEDLFLVWFDGRDDDFEVYFKHSPDAGFTWGPDVRLTKSRGDSAHPTVAARAGAVHVLWHDIRDGNAEIYYRRGVARKFSGRSD
jgi:hypothetical protein